MTSNFPSSRIRAIRGPFTTGRPSCCVSSGDSVPSPLRSRITSSPAGSGGASGSAPWRSEL